MSLPESIERGLHAYYDGELGWLAKWRFERRLSRSAELREELESLRQLSELTAEAEPSVTLAAGSVWEGIEGRLRAVDAELEAVEMQFQLEAAKAKTRFEEGKSALQGKIDAFNNALSEKRKTTTEKFGAFESELTDGLAKIKDAFNNLIR